MNKQINYSGSFDKLKSSFFLDAQEDFFKSLSHVSESTLLGLTIQMCINNRATYGNEEILKVLRSAEKDRPGSLKMVIGAEAYAKFVKLKS